MEWEVWKKWLLQNTHSVSNGKMATEYTFDVSNGKVWKSGYRIHIDVSIKEEK